MKNVLSAIFLLCTLELSALQKQPWLGNWLEFEASIYQTHSQSRSVDTANGSKHKFLHAERTTASIEFMPLVDFSTELELDVAKTQKEAFGFEAIKASCRYRLLNDLTGDPVTLTAGLVTSLSTPTRVRDLSSQSHGVFEVEARLSLGREFAIHDKSYYKAWGLAKTGIASSGAPWIGLEAHFGPVIHEQHYLDLFFRAEKGLSSHKLHHLSDFHSWSRIGYQFEEVGLSYALKDVPLGTFYIEATKRLHASLCPKHTWSLRLGVDIPFSPW